MTDARPIASAMSPSPLTSSTTLPLISTNLKASENSDVLLSGAVAVAVTTSPPITVTGSAVVNEALPLPSVTAVPEPR